VAVAVEFDIGDVVLPFVQSTIPASQDQPGCEPVSSGVGYSFSATFGAGVSRYVLNVGCVNISPLIERCYLKSRVIHRPSSSVGFFGILVRLSQVAL
jgi:hypothetical protein